MVMHLQVRARIYSAKRGLSGENAVPSHILQSQNMHKTKEGWFAEGTLCPGACELDEWKEDECMNVCVRGARRTKCCKIGPTLAYNLE